MSDLFIARHCSDHHGIITADALSRLGADRFAEHRRRNGGLLIREHEGVYRHAACPPTWEASLLAAVLAVGRQAAASGPSAMKLFGVRGEWAPRPEVTYLGPTRLQLPGVRLRRLDRLEIGDVHHRLGIPVLAPPLALLLLGASASPAHVEAATHDMVFNRLTTRAKLIDALIRYGARGRRGTTALRQAIRSLDREGGATQTNLELRLLRMLRAGGVAEPYLQHAVVDLDGRKHRLDLAWPDAMVDVETDGDRWHLSPADRASDRRRDEALRAIGWTVIRVDSADVELRPWETVAAIQRSLVCEER